MWQQASSAKHTDNPDLVSDRTSGHPLPSLSTDPHGLPQQEQHQWPSGKIQDACMKGYSDSGKCHSLYDSGRTDSGFLSGANLTSEVLSDELTSSRYKDSGIQDNIPSPREEKEEPMKLDSGVDVSLNDQFSSLSIQHSTLNDLSGSSSKSSQITDSAHVSNIISSPTSRSQPQIYGQNVSNPTIASTWELYFQQDQEGDTQLHIAIIQGFIEVVYSLIRMVPHPCYLDILNDVCQAPLHLAVLTHQPRIVRRLVVAGANLDMRDAHGNTPLHLACQTGDLECVKALTEPVTVAESSNASLQYTAYMHQIPQNLEERNYDGQMYVHLAAIGGHVDILRHLVWFGANINAREAKAGRTALHYAVEYGIHKVANYLLKECALGPQGVELETATYAGYTAYQLAACVDSALARELADKGALPRSFPDDDSDSDFSDEEMFGIPSGNYYATHRLNGEPINISA